MLTIPIQFVAGPYILFHIFLGWILTPFIDFELALGDSSLKRHFFVYLIFYNEANKIVNGFVFMKIEQGRVFLFIGVYIIDTCSEIDHLFQIIA